MPWFWEICFLSWGIEPATRKNAETKGFDFSQKKIGGKK